MQPGGTRFTEFLSFIEQASFDKTSQEYVARGIHSLAEEKHPDVRLIKVYEDIITALFNSKRENKDAIFLQQSALDAIEQVLITKAKPYQKANFPEPDPGYTALLDHLYEQYLITTNEALRQPLTSQFAAKIRANVVYRLDAKFKFVGLQGNQIFDIFDEKNLSPHEKEEMLQRENISSLRNNIASAWRNFWCNNTKLSSLVYSEKILFLHTIFMLYTLPNIDTALETVIISNEVIKDTLKACARDEKYFQSCCEKSNLGKFYLEIFDKQKVAKTPLYNPYAYLLNQARKDPEIFARVKKVMGQALFDGNVFFPSFQSPIAKLEEWCQKLEVLPLHEIEAAIADLSMEMKESASAPPEQGAIQNMVLEHRESEGQHHAEIEGKEEVPQIEGEGSQVEGEPKEAKREAKRESLPNLRIPSSAYQASAVPSLPAAAADEEFEPGCEMDEGQQPGCEVTEENEPGSVNAKRAVVCIM